MFYTKCPICNKGSVSSVCCGRDKQTGEVVKTFFDWLKCMIKIDKKS